MTTLINSATRVTQRRQPNLTESDLNELSSNNTTHKSVPTLASSSTTPASRRVSNQRPITEWVRIKLGQLNPTLYLENKASVARDHLANERTFLAWLRTSLSFISIGVAITQLFRLNITTRSPIEEKVGKPLGVVFILLGIIFLSFGFVRYFHSQHTLTTGKFPASRGTVVLGSIFTMLSLAGCLCVILIVDSGK
ncbi:hypothetical protein G9A89_007126 [Geosiphon pyriformis]|nr:hypothetical protein G9A89_007126 [Geosiphon pyriformis]